MKQNIAVFVFLSLSILIHSHSYNFHNFIFPDGWIHLIVYVYHIFYPFFWWTELHVKFLKSVRTLFSKKPTNFKVGLFECHSVILHSRKACLKLCLRIFIEQTYKSVLKIIYLPRAWRWEKFFPRVPQNHCPLYIGYKFPQ